MIGAINKILKKLVGDKTQQDLKDINPVVEQIKQIGQTLTTVTHDELRQRTQQLKQRIKERTADSEAANSPI